MRPEKKIDRWGRRDIKGEKFISSSEAHRSLGDGINGHVILADFRYRMKT